MQFTFTTALLLCLLGFGVGVFGTQRLSGAVIERLLAVGLLALGLRLILSVAI